MAHRRRVFYEALRVRISILATAPSHMPYTLMQTEVAIRNNLLLTGGPYVF